LIDWQSWKGPNYEALFKAAAKAYEISNANPSMERPEKSIQVGRFIQPESLGKNSERQLLKKHLFTITELQKCEKSASVRPISVIELLELWRKKKWRSWFCRKLSCLKNQKSIPSHPKFGINWSYHFWYRDYRSSIKDRLYSSLGGVKIQDQRNMIENKHWSFYPIFSKNLGKKNPLPISWLDRNPKIKFPIRDFARAKLKNTLGIQFVAHHIGFWYREKNAKGLQPFWIGKNYQIRWFWHHWLWLSN